MSKASDINCIWKHSTVLNNTGSHLIFIFFSQSLLDSFTEIKQKRADMLWNNISQTILNRWSGGVKKGDPGVQALEVERLCSAAVLLSLEAKRCQHGSVLFSVGNVFIQHCMMGISAKKVLLVGAQTGACSARQPEATVCPFPSAWCSSPGCWCTQGSQLTNPD